jgi:hypothetical protein
MTSDSIRDTIRRHARTEAKSHQDQFEAVAQYRYQYVYQPPRVSRRYEGFVAPSKRRVA